MDEISPSKRAHAALIKLLQKYGLLSSADRTKSFSDADFFPIAFFAREGLLDEGQAIRQISTKLNIPEFSVRKENSAHLLSILDQEIVKRLDLSSWKAIRALPCEVHLDHLVVAMANPLDHETKSALEFKIGFKVEIGIAREDEIIALLSTKLSDSPAFNQEFLDAVEEEAITVPKTSGVENIAYAAEIDAAPVVKLVNKIISDASQAGASDIHISPEKEGLSVRIRVDGVMRHLYNTPEALKNSVLSRIKLLCGMDISERRKPQDGRFRMKTGFGIKDLRVSTIPTVHGENLVARILSSDLSRTSFEQLGMPEHIAQRLGRDLKGSSRVILVCGPTGSGKTSTLYAGLLSLCDGAHNVITIEDPIEYRVAGVQQIQVNPKVGLSFAEGLRSVLRQDPDVIMVGEIRDRETAEIAMQAAQTGHLVLSTLHTNTAAAALTRLRDLGIANYLLASSLGTILAQRLARKLCDKCKKPAPAELREQITELGVTGDAACEAGGCEWCENTGYVGRVGIYSYLSINESVREAIRNNAGELEVEKLAPDFGTLADHGKRLIETGVTTLQEVERVLGPLEKSGAAQVSPITPDRKAAESSTGLRRRKLLLVEDDENTRTILSMLFSKEQFDVTEAENGIQGLERVYEEVPDIIVSDLMMPKMTGKEMVRKLRQDSRLKDIPVLILTAAANEDNELQLFEGGASDFVSKTTNPKIMLSRIQRLLNS